MTFVCQYVLVWYNSKVFKFIDRDWFNQGIICIRGLSVEGSKVTFQDLQQKRKVGCKSLVNEMKRKRFQKDKNSSTLPHVLLSPRIIMLCHCSSAMTKDHFLVPIVLIFNNHKRSPLGKVLGELG